MRRALILVVFLVVALVGAHALAWRWAVGTLADQFAAWAARERAHGLTVSSDPPIRGGWPMAAELTLPQTHIEQGGASPARIAWTAQRVVIGVALLHPRTLTVGAEGMQLLRLGDGPELPFTADGLRATIPLQPGAPAREVDIAASHLRAGLPLGAAADGGTATGGLTIALLSLHATSTPAAAQGEAALAFAGSAQDIGLPGLPAGHVWPLGPRIASVSVEGAVNGPVPRAADPVAKATGWRDGGGTLEIGRFAIGWGPLGLNGSATIALDDAMQPMGTATAHIVGAPEALDALAANGVIGQRTALAAKAVLSLMAKEPEGGGSPQVDVPLTLQGRKLAMGRIPLAVLPQLIWPGSHQGAIAQP
jgi:hypothetical protein